MNRREFNQRLLSLVTVYGLPGGLLACASTEARNNGQATVAAVNTHAHVFHRDLPFVPDRRYTPDYDAFPQEYPAKLDHDGISHGVIIPISILGTNSDYIVEVLRQSAGRLRGLAMAGTVNGGTPEF